MVHANLARLACRPPTQEIPRPAAVTVLSLNTVQMVLLSTSSSKQIRDSLETVSPPVSCFVPRLCPGFAVCSRKVGRLGVHVNSPCKV